MRRFDRRAGLALIAVAAAIGLLVGPLSGNAWTGAGTAAVTGIIGLTAGLFGQWLARRRGSEAPPDLAK